MKWAQTLEEGARLLQGNVTTDERHDVCAGEDFSDGLVRNHAVFSPWLLEWGNGGRSYRNTYRLMGQPDELSQRSHLAVVFLPIDAVTLKVRAELRNEFLARAVQR